MKTFEERYTAWIDGKLDGPALTAFELELSRRASAGEARADKEDAGRLHLLLTTHLKAPAMTNAEFFSHQLRERIEAERVAGRRREDGRQARFSLITWPFARLAGLAAALLFVATALYYGMMPPHAVAPASSVALNASSIKPAASVDTPVPAPDPLTGTKSASDEIWARASPTPTPLDLNDIQVVPVPGAPTNTSATALQLKDPNVSVLWINGLDYMPGRSRRIPDFECRAHADG